MTRHVPVKLPRHVRRMMAAPPVLRYHRREFRTSDQRNALYVQLHGRVPGLVRYSDVTEAGTIYVLAWPEQGRGIGANRDTTPASMVPPPLQKFLDIGLGTSSMEIPEPELGISPKLESKSISMEIK